VPLEACFVSGVTGRYVAVQSFLLADYAKKMLGLLKTFG
jgi:hypothetical protein